MEALKGNFRVCARAKPTHEAEDTRYLYISRAQTVGNAQPEPMAPHFQFWSLSGFRVLHPGLVEGSVYGGLALADKI